MARVMIAAVAVLVIAASAMAVDPAKYPPRQQQPVQINTWGGSVDVNTPGANVRVHPRPVLFPLLRRLFAPPVQIYVQPSSDRPDTARPLVQPQPKLDDSDRY